MATAAVARSEVWRLPTPEPSWSPPEPSSISQLSECSSVTIVPYGRTFFKRFYSVSQCSKKRRKKNKGSKESDDGLPSTFKIEPDCDYDEYYALLGLRDKGSRCTQEDIKKAYRKISLLFHPDKAVNQGVPVKEAEARFKAIQKAHDTLSNPYERRLHDSKQEFNDDIPDSDIDFKTEQEFFDEYSPVIDRFVKLSEEYPVPTLGTLETEDDEVNEFYEFWFAFRSWRDFGYLGEYNLEDADNRDERRWMEQQNKAAGKKAKREEAKLIRKLVDQCYSNDPRIKRMKAAKKAAREAVKAEKKAHRQRLREEKEAARRKIEEEAEKVVAAEEKKEEEKAKEIKKLNKAMNKLRKKIRKLYATPAFEECPNKEKITELILQDASFDQLQKVFTAVSASPEGHAKTKKIYKKLKKKRDKRAAEKKAEEERQRAQEKKLEEEKHKREKWSDEELNLLAKAVCTYPSGTSERWEKIRLFMDGARTCDEIIKKVRSMGKKKKKDKKKSKRRKESVEDSTVWSNEQQKEFESAIKQCKALPAATRWDEIAKLVDGKNKEECIDRFKYIRAQLLAKKRAAAMQTTG